MRRSPVLLVVALCCLSGLAAQRLQDESLGYLLGGFVYPQDRVLGLMYVPEGASRAGEQVFELVRNFWNQVNTGRLDTALLSRDGQVQVREQLAPFLRNTPNLYRESLKEPSKQFGSGFQKEQEAAEPGSNHVPSQEAKQDEAPPPMDYLQLQLVRMGTPVLEGDYARAKCRLEIKGESAFIQVGMYFLQTNGVWQIDALDWQSKDIRQGDSMDVFGRKRELYSQ